MPVGLQTTKMPKENTSLGISPEKNGKRTSKKLRRNERHTSPDSKCHSDKKKRILPLCCLSVKTREADIDSTVRSFTLKLFTSLWCSYSPCLDPCGSCFSPNPMTPEAPPQPKHKHTDYYFYTARLCTHKNFSNLLSWRHNAAFPHVLLRIRPQNFPKPITTHIPVSTCSRPILYDPPGSVGPLLTLRAQTFNVAQCIREPGVSLRPVRLPSHVYCSCIVVSPFFLSTWGCSLKE